MCDSRKVFSMADNEKTPKKEEEKKVNKQGAPTETSELEDELDKVAGGGNYNCGCGIE
jgi:hypothetical protein